MNQNKAKALNGVSASFLKAAACITMLIDHTAAIVLEEFLDYINNPLIKGMHLIGRISFVLFAFLLVEGFLHTHDIKRYLLRLLLFAAVAEIPYNISGGGGYLDFTRQNVLWTLAAGLGAIWCIRELKKGKIILKTLIVLAFCLTAILIRSDYTCLGVLLIVVLYLFREKPFQRFLFACLTLYFGQIIDWYGIATMQYGLKFLTGGALVRYDWRVIAWEARNEVYGALAFIFISFYNHSKGQQLPKLFFYLFYPVHLLILWEIRNRYLGYRSLFSEPPMIAALLICGIGFVVFLVIRKLKKRRI